MKITFVGGGNMAQAIIGGLLRKNPPVVGPSDIHVVEIAPQTRAKIEQVYGVRCFDEAYEAWKALDRDDVVIFAVKPQQMKAAADELRQGYTKGLGPIENLVISIAAGVRLSDLSRWLGSHTRLIRAMPNTPALIGEGVTALYPIPHHVSEEDMRKAEQILGSIGLTVKVTDEKEGDRLLDAVTAISGSGPAYVFLFIEAMEQAGVELGLSPENVRTLVLQTFLGATKLAASSSEPISKLRERVTSKGGTTERALASMDEDKVKQAIVRAIRAANDRGRELGDELGRD